MNDQLRINGLDQAENLINHFDQGLSKRNHYSLNIFKEERRLLFKVLNETLKSDAIGLNKNSLSYNKFG